MGPPLFGNSQHARTLDCAVEIRGATEFSGEGDRVSRRHGSHGRYGQPCPRCGDKVLRIRYADKETNYCARCQTEGKVLADRSLSRLLGSDWPRTLEELENLKRRQDAVAAILDLPRLQSQHLI